MHAIQLEMFHVCGLLHQQYSSVFSRFFECEMAKMEEEYYASKKETLWFMYSKWDRLVTIQFIVFHIIEHTKGDSLFPILLIVDGKKPTEPQKCMSLSLCVCVRESV